MLKVELFDEKIKTKAMTAVSSLAGVQSVSVDMKNKKMTLTGDIDPVKVVAKLRKLCHTDIDSVGPEKEEKKKEEPKKEEPKKPEEKPKDQAKAAEELLKAYQQYHAHMLPPSYFVRSVEEDPNACVIC